MTKKRSFTEIMQAEGITDFDNLTNEAVEKLIREGKINSAYSHVRTLEEFDGLRWGYASFHDINDWNDFSSYVKRGILSLKYDSLGELLHTANFCGKNSIDDEWKIAETFVEKEESKGYLRVGIGYDRAKEEKELNEEEKYNQAFKVVQDLGIDPEEQTPYLAQGVEVPELITFIDAWDTAQGKRKRWNPSYAKPVQSEKLYQFIGNRNPQAWLEELDENLHGTVLAKGSIYLPFDAWTIAECFRRWYESGKK